MSAYCSSADDDTCCWCSDLLTPGERVESYGHVFCTVGCLIEWEESA